MLGKYKFLAATALMASMAVTACDSNDGGGGLNALGGGQEAPEAGPLGLSSGAPVDVASADRQAGNSVSVAGDEATMTLNELTFDGDGNVDAISVTIGLPDGSEVTFDDTASTDDYGLIDINGQETFLAQFTSADGDVVQVAIGLGLGPDPLAATVETSVNAALVMLARTDLKEADGGPADQGFNTYLLTGDETATMPEGSGAYSGRTVASIYNDDDGLVNDNVFGYVSVEAYFDTSTVNILLDGKGGDASYQLFGEDLAVVGSSYDGAISGFVDDGGGAVAVEGDLLGAFYGDDAEATAGIFGAEETAFERMANGEDIAIVGGYIAYDDTYNEDL